MRFREINEVSHVDLYPAQFGVFRAKWLPFASPPGRFYVNFTDHVGNTLDRSFSPKPNHHDPAGLYAYPLDYVLNHPTDIEYGQQARFLRVIQDTSSHKLVLQTLTMDTALGYLKAMGVEEPEKKMAHMKRTFHWKGGSPVAMAFFGVVQYYTEIGQKRCHTNNEQSRLFLSAGIDALEDRATGASDAVIYKDEPEQIVFMRRSAFKVVDAYELRSSQSVNIARANPAEMLRRLPALIAAAIDDRVVNGHSNGSLDHEQTYYTAAGRKLVIAMSKEYSFLRGHREGTTSSEATINVRLLGPGFTPIVRSYDKDATFTQIAADMKERFAARVPGEGKEQSRANEFGAVADRYVQIYAQLAEKLRLPFDAPAPGSNLAYLVFAATRPIEQVLNYVPSKKHGDRPAHIIKEFWARFRRQPIQADQMIAIWAKGMKKSGVRKHEDIYKLEDLAARLGIKQSSAASSDTGSPKTGFQMQIVGSNIMAGTEKQMIAIGEVDNQNTTWNTPKVANTPAYLPFANDIVKFLNANALFVSGYTEFLAHYFGIFYDGHIWKTLEQAVEPDDLGNGVSLWALPTRHGKTVCARYFDKRPGIPSATAEATKPRTYCLMEPILFLDDKGDVLSIQQNYERFLRFGAEKYKSVSYVNGLHGGENENTEKIVGLFQALAASGFDLKTYMAAHNMGFSRFFSDDISYLGLVHNRRNGKTGKTIAEVLAPEGTYAGLEVGSFKPKYGNLDYYVAHDRGWEQAFTMEMDPQEGVRPIKVEKISDDLTNEQRLAVREFLAKHDLALSKKFAPFLTVAKAKKVTK